VKATRLSFEPLTRSVTLTRREKFPCKATCVWVFFHKNPQKRLDTKKSKAENSGTLYQLPLVLNSHQFRSKVSDLLLIKKTNVWHLHSCNTSTPSILCILRLWHKKLNIGGNYNQIFQCGSIKTKLHIFFECPSIYTSRQILISKVCNILVHKNLYSRSKILLFGHRAPSKNLCLCLFKQKCLFLSKNPPF